MELCKYIDNKLNILKLESFDKETLEINWTSIFNNKNNNKLLYSLHIIESIIEDNNIMSEKVELNDYDLELFEGFIGAGSDAKAQPIIDIPD